MTHAGTSLTGVGEGVLRVQEVFVSDGREPSHSRLGVPSVRGLPVGGG